MTPIKPGTARRLGLRDPTRPEVEYARYPQRIVMGSLLSESIEQFTRAMRDPGSRRLMPIPDTP